MAEKDEEPKRWGPVEMLLTVLATLGGVAIGAWIFYLASNRREARPAFAAHAPMPTVDLSPQIAQIRALLRAANKGAPGDAAAAIGMLDALEQTYGYEAVASVCNPEKLRGLAAKVQARLAS